MTDFTIDYNCDVAQSYGIYQNEEEYKIAKYSSSINISAGFHAGDPIAIRKALLFAKENNVSIGAHIGYPDIQGFGRRKMDLQREEFIAVVTYQIGAIISYADTFDLTIEQVRAHSALKDAINSDALCLEYLAEAVKKINPWLNIIVQNVETKKTLESLGLKAALEVDYTDELDINNLSSDIDTIHFRKLEDIIKARSAVLSSCISPINYNRVVGQI